MGRLGISLIGGRKAGALLALLLVFRLLVPAGWMIAPSQAGGPGFVLCDGAVAAAPAMHGHARDHDGPAPAKTSDGHCPYAALASPALPPAPPSITVPVLSPDLAQQRISRDGRRLGLASPPPPATGPPLRA
ncbi:MAG: DUF2946 family protein [Allosphingosinicella sp.]